MPDTTSEDALRRGSSEVMIVSSLHFLTKKTYFYVPLMYYILCNTVIFKKSERIRWPLSHRIDASLEGLLQETNIHICGINVR